MHRLLPLGAAATALALVAAVPASADSISFLRSGDVWVASPDGADGGRYFSPTWSPDGSRIAFNTRAATSSSARCPARRAAAPCRSRAPSP